MFLPRTHTILLDGSYGSSRADFAAFVTILLIAGSTGVKISPLILFDIARGASSQKLPVRRIKFA